MGSGAAPTWAALRAWRGERHGSGCEALPEVRGGAPPPPPCPRTQDTAGRRRLGAPTALERRSAARAPPRSAPSAAHPSANARAMLEHSQASLEQRISGARAAPPMSGGAVVSLRDIQRRVARARCRADPWVRGLRSGAA